MQIPKDGVKRRGDIPTCVYCGKPPTETDWLGELVRHSNAVAHQSCAKSHNKIFGLNAGTMQEVGNVIKALGGEQ